MISAGMRIELPLIGPIPPSASAVPTATPRITGGNDQISSISGLQDRVDRPAEVAAQQADQIVPKTMMMTVAIPPITSEVRPP